MSKQEKIPMIHGSADVQTKEIGPGTTIWQSCVILPGAVIGRDCNINAFCFIENDVLIGDRVTLKCGVYLWDRITLEDDVFIGPGVAFSNDNFPRSKRYQRKLVPTVIKKGASVGTGSVLKGGITIGEYALVGVGSIITKDIPAHALYYGTPAKHQGWVCCCSSKLNTKLKCPVCQLRYKKSDNGLVLINS